MEKALSLEIDNIREKYKRITSDPFSSGGCEWFVRVYPFKFFSGGSTLGLYLRVLNPEYLRSGWKRRIRFCFVGLLQSGEQLFKFSDVEDKVITYNIWSTMHGFERDMGLPILQKLDNNKLIIEVYIHVVEVVPPVIIDFNGFQILSSQAESVSKIYAEHPDFALDFKPSNQGVKTAYMNLLLLLIETLYKSPPSLFMTDLTNAQRELTNLTEAGFKLDWLNSKLEEVFLEREKALSDGSWVEQLEERVKTLELTLSEKEHIESDDAAAKLSSQAESVSKIYAEQPDFAVDFKASNQGVKTAYMNLLLHLIETLDKSPQSLFMTDLTNAQRELTDLTEAGFKLDWLNSKLEEVLLERKKALSDGSWVEQLEERVKTLELKHINSAATPKPSSFEIIYRFAKRFFLSTSDKSTGDKEKQD